MATVTATVNTLKTFGDDCRIVTWTPLTTTNADGSAFEMPGWADRSIQVLGTFGAGGTVVIEGTNEATPTNWHTLNDPSSAALSYTGAKIEGVLECPRRIRPRVSAGDGTTSLTVHMLVRNPCR
jgi:hypothetical protein